MGRSRRRRCTGWSRNACGSMRSRCASLAGSRTPRLSLPMRGLRVQMLPRADAPDFEGGERAENRRMASTTGFTTPPRRTYPEQVSVERNHALISSIVFGCFMTSMGHHHAAPDLAAALEVGERLGRAVDEPALDRDRLDLAALGQLE